MLAEIFMLRLELIRASIPLVPNIRDARFVPIGAMLPGRVGLAPRGHEREVAS